MMKGDGPNPRDIKGWSKRGMAAFDTLFVIYRYIRTECISQ